MRHRQLGAMRSVFWLLGLAALAVALALLVGDNNASVALFWPPLRYDISFNLFLFGGIALFLLIHLALRAVSLLRELPVQARRWRRLQAERAVVSSILDALSHQLAGRFVRAQMAARHAVELLQLPSAADWPRRDQWMVLAHLMVAESAQSLQNRDQRDRFLQAALQPALQRGASEATEGALLRAVHWALEDRDVAAARARFADLPQRTARRIQAVRLKLRMAQLGHATADALEAARLLAKHRAFSPDAARSVIRSLLLDALREAHDLTQLEKVWAGLDAAERQTPEMALAAARRAEALVATAPDPAALHQRVREWLEPLWTGFDQLSAGQQHQMVLAIEAGLASLDAAGLAALEQRQRQRPGNACLQYLAGQACMQRQLWGKAAQLLGQARHGLSDPVLLRRTWRSLARLAEERGDDAAAQAAWKAAAQID